MQGKEILVSLNSEETEDREEKERVLGMVGIEEAMVSMAEASHMSRCSRAGGSTSTRGPWVSTFHGGVWEKEREGDPETVSVSFQGQPWWPYSGGISPAL